jgi:hypothetical protein
LVDVEAAELLRPGLTQIQRSVVSVEKATD